MHPIDNVPCTVLEKVPFTNPTLRSSGLNWNAVVWALVIMGIALRLFHFFYNRSLWIDESYLVASLIERDFVQLAQPPLEY